MKERIQWVLQYLDQSMIQFANELGVQRSTMTHLMSGRNLPSFNFLRKLADKHPEININWLLTGKGDQINTEKKVDQKFKKEVNLFAKEEPVEKEEFEPNLHLSETITNKKEVSNIIVVYTDSTFQYLNPSNTL